MTADTVILASHFQNENCHPDGKIKIGIGPDSAWRWERLENAKRLFAGARPAGIPIVHIRLAVPADMGTVIQNNYIFRQWVELGAWAEGTWGVEFIDGLGPIGAEKTVNLSILVGKGIGPFTRAPVRFAVCTISLAERSIKR